jgi:hypothetical protein
MSHKVRMDMDQVPDFQGVEPGRHRAKLIETLDAVSNAGNDMITWKWEVIEGPEQGKTAMSYTSLLEDALSGLKTHLKAFGYTGVVDTDTTKLHGKTAIIIVTKRKVRNKDTGEEEERSSISNVLPDTTASRAPVKAPPVRSDSGSKSRSGSSSGKDGIPF